MTYEEIKYYIFGAHSRAQTFAAYMKDLYPEKECLGFLFDNEEKNPEYILGLPVIDLKGESSVETDRTVYLAVRGSSHPVIEKVLREKGFGDIIPVTPEMDTDMRNRFIPKEFVRQGRSFCRIDDSEISNINEESDLKISVYVAKTPFDQPISKNVSLKAYEHVIQVGTALTDERIPDGEFLDDRGDNISKLNRQFSELTGMYWLWKHSDDDVIGLEHYRRRFLLPENWQQLFATGDVDVILPVPLFVSPSLRDNYLFRHDRRPWDTMLHIMEEDDPDMCQAAQRFFSQNGCYSPCNMLIARKKVFNELCGWMFPILLKCSEKVGEIEDRYQNRYSGFLSERMISFFFFYYTERYKLMYADKSFLG